MRKLDIKQCLFKNIKITLLTCEPYPSKMYNSIYFKYAFFCKTPDRSGQASESLANLPAAGREKFPANEKMSKFEFKY